MKRRSYLFIVTEPLIVYGSTSVNCSWPGNNNLENQSLQVFYLNSKTERSSEHIIYTSPQKAIEACKRPPPGLYSQIGATESWRSLLEDEDLSGSGPRLVPGFLCYSFGMFPECSGMPGNVASEEIRLTWTKRPEFESLSNWNKETVSSSPCPIFPLAPEWCNSRNLANSCVLWLAVPTVFFMTFAGNCCQLSLVPLSCHFEGKSRTVFELELIFYF